VKGAPRIFDADGAEIGLGDTLQSVILDEGLLKVSGYSTQSPNAECATLFVIADDGEEMPWHLHPTGDPDQLRSRSLQLAPADKTADEGGHS
jgi:hypothetical protein